MKESKPYPRIDEEDGSVMMANEPVGAVAYADEIMVNDFRPIPGLPETWSELQECLKEGEKEIERGEYVEWDNFVQQMKQTIRDWHLFHPSTNSTQVC